MESRTIYAVFHDDACKDGYAVEVAIVERENIGEIYRYLDQNKNQLKKRAIEHNTERQRQNIAELRARQSFLRRSGKFEEADEIIVPTIVNKFWGFNFTGKIERCTVTKSRKVRK